MKIKGLLIKDGLLIWKQAKIMVLLALLYAVIGALDGKASWVAFSALFMAMLPISALGFDERSRWDRYAVMLPYNKRELVIGKYLLGAAGVVAMVVIYGVLAAGVQIVRGETPQTVRIAQTMMTMTASSFLFMGVSLPIMFKTGVEKGRLWFFLLVMLGMACTVYLITAVSSSQEILYALGVITAGNSGNLWVVGLLLAVPAASILLLILSSLISIGIYKRKDL